MPLSALTPSENISFLVEIRQRHQTKEAEKGVCLASTGTKTLTHHPFSGASNEPISEHRLLAQKICDIIKAVDNDKENVGSSTGLNRRVRWTKPPGLYSSSPALSNIKDKPKRGNSANALEVAQKAANLVRFSDLFVRRSMSNGTHLLQIVKKRRAAFADLPFKEDLSTAKVNALTILQRGSYGIAAIENDLMICQGTRLVQPCVVGLTA